MKPRRVISVTALVLLLVLVMASMGCGKGGGAVGLMGKIPDDSTYFTFENVKAARDDNDLDDLYTDWKDGYKDDLENYGIDCDDVNGLGYGGGVQLVDGKFDLEEVRSALDEANYDDDEYKGVEVWKSDWEWVALLNNLVIIGNEENVKDCIRVIKEGDDSLAGKQDAKDVMGRLPSGIAMYYSTYEEYEGMVALGYSAEKKDKDTLKVTAVYKFHYEEDADRATSEIDGDIHGEEDFRNIDVHQDGKFVIATAEIDIDDFASIMY